MSGGWPRRRDNNFRFTLAKSRSFNQFQAMTESKTPPEVKPEEKPAPKPPREIGGPKGPEPTRYGDWEKNGRCTDF